MFNLNIPQEVPNQQSFSFNNLNNFIERKDLIDTIKSMFCIDLITHLLGKGEQH